MSICDNHSRNVAVRDAAKLMAPKTAKVHHLQLMDRRRTIDGQPVASCRNSPIGVCDVGCVSGVGTSDVSSWRRPLCGVPMAERCGTSDASRPL